MTKTKKPKVKVKPSGLVSGVIIIAMSGALVNCTTLAPTSTVNTTSSSGSSQATVRRPQPLQIMPSPSSWQLHYISNTNVAEAMQYRTFHLQYENRQLSGYAGNNFSTTATFHTNGSLSIDPRLKTTRLFVQGLKGQMEKRYFQLLSQAQQWTINNHRLIIRSPHGELHFEPSQRR